VSSTEKRRSLRQNVRWQGLIHDEQGSIVATCMMTDVSASGAKLIMEARINVPDWFVLTLARNAGVRRNCEVAWRRAKSIGVRFVAPPR
jgi:PilZ domain